MKHRVLYTCNACKRIWGMTNREPGFCPFCNSLDFRRLGMIEKDHIDNWFTYHAPSPEQALKYEAIREAGKNLANVILDSTPPSADQTTAIRKVRESVMTANAAIACDGQ